MSGRRSLGAALRRLSTEHRVLWIVAATFAIAMAAVTGGPAAAVGAAGALACIGAVGIASSAARGRTTPEEGHECSGDVDAALQSTVDLRIQRRALQRFCATMNHDLRAPLRNAGLLTGWLRQDLNGPQLDDVRENLDLLDNSVRRMSELVGGSVAYAKAACMELALRPLSLEQVIQDAAASALDGATEGVALEGALPAITSDPRALQRILAAQIAYACGTCGEVETEVRIEGVVADGTLVLTVACEKPRTDERARSDPFELFEGAATQADLQGVDLPIAHLLAERLGGDLECGAIIECARRTTLRLPLRRGETDLAARAEAAAANDSLETVEIAPGERIAASLDRADEATREPVAGSAQ